MPNFLMRRERSKATLGRGRQYRKKKVQYRNTVEFMENSRFGREQNNIERNKEAVLLGEF